MKHLNYNQMTLRYLREQGVICDRAERWNPYAGKFGIRQDMFGFIDLVALYPGNPGYIAAIQSTSGLCHSEHRRKILEDCIENATAWCKASGKIYLISWTKKLLHRGGKARRWVPRVEEIKL